MIRNLKEMGKGNINNKTLYTISNKNSKKNNNHEFKISFLLDLLLTSS